MCNASASLLYPRRILLAVTGLTPQVVTETVYALLHSGGPMPTEIHVLSTAKGRDEAGRALLGDDPGWFGKLRRDYALPPIAFDETHLHVLEDAAGRPLEDIRGREDNDLAADGITGWVRRLTGDPDSELHVSLAGGRKTMGFYAGYALSLFGRPQDRLSHVLVSAPYESLPGFFYPTPYPHPVSLHKGEGEVDASLAQVTLADIPFLRLRHGLPDGLADSVRFSEIVRTAQRALGPAEVWIDYAGRRLVAGGVAVRLSPVDLAFYGWLARRAANGREAVMRPGKKGVPSVGYGEEFLAEYRLLDNDPEMDGRIQRSLRHGMEAAWFDNRLVKVNGGIEDALSYAASPYRIADSGQRPKQYRLLLLPGQIHFGPALAPG
jgi:CRISPR-associated protein (TIGR02584 family)